MTPQPKPREGRTRAVLGVVISGRYAGHTCLDGFGLERPGTKPYGTWCLRYARGTANRAALLESKLKRTIARFRPSLVVLATRRRTQVELRLLDAAVRACLSSSTHFVLAAAHDGLHALGWKRGRSLPDTLRMLTRHFLPELRKTLPPDRVGLVYSATWRYRCVTWQAAALALLELSRHRPWSAVALVRDRPPRCRLLDDLERAVLLTDPAGMTAVAV